MPIKHTPAFPVPMIPYPNGGCGDVQSTGMTLRDYRAVHILAGLIANRGIVAITGVDDQYKYAIDNGESREALCHRAYMIADDMVSASEIRSLQPEAVRNT